jgi:hypothetical protein
MIFHARAAFALIAFSGLLGSGLAGCYPRPVPYPGGNSHGDPNPWRTLYNGKDLSGWKPFLPDASADPSKTWFVNDTILCCTGSPAGYLATTEEFTDFELEVDWRFDPKKGAGNSGVLLRVQKKDEVWPKSMEAQLQSGSAGDIWNIGDFPAKVDAARTNGRHTRMMGKPAEVPLGGWNHYRIVMDGGRLELYVNGQLQNVATDVERVPGRIALQSEGAWIEFGMVRIRPLKGDGTGRGYDR